MSRTRLTPSSLPTDNAAGFIASLFRDNACIEKAFQQEGGELQYLEECWSDSAVLQFILLGWIGLILKGLLFLLLVTLVAACIQGRRPWYVFVSCVKKMGSFIGGICSCFELDDEERERGASGEMEKGLGTVWQEHKKGGGYFSSPKEKVLMESSKQSLTNALTLNKRSNLTERRETDVESPQPRLARKESLPKVGLGDKQGMMLVMDYCNRWASKFAFITARRDKPRDDNLEAIQVIVSRK